MRQAWVRRLVAVSVGALIVLGPFPATAGAQNRPARPPRDANKQQKKEPEKDEAVDPFVRAEAAMRAQRFGAAVPLLRDFVGASAGDSRLPAAKAMLFDAYRARADKALHEGDACGSARGLIEGAGFYKAGDEADALREQARTTLQSTFDAAKQKEPEYAAEVAREFARLFKDRPPLADEDELHRLEVSAFAQAARKKAPPELLWAKLAALRAAGVKNDAFEEQKVDPDNLAVAYAEELMNRRKWYSKAIEVLRGLEEKAKDDQAARRYQTLVAKALGGHAEAVMALGNRELLEQAAQAMEAYPGGFSTPAGRKIKAARAKGAGKETRPLVPETDKPLIGEGNLVDSGAGIVITDRLQIGREKGEEGRNDGVITVPAGAVIDGGKIAVEKGRLLIKGQPDRPVVLRGVEFSCHLGGSLTAENAVFIDCKFHKAGGWFFEFYTTQWTFNNCALLRTNFHNLNKTDYGIKLSKCTLVECNLPTRLLHRDKPEDVAARYKDGWNAVEDCDFLMCDVRPSFVWTTERCNFSLCRVADGGTDLFQSTTPLDVAFFAPKTDAAFVRDLKTNTDSSLQGQLRYLAAAKEFPHKGGSALWPWMFVSKDLLAAPTSNSASAP